MNKREDGHPPPRRRSAWLAVVLLLVATLGLTTIGGVGYLLWPGWPQPAADAPALPVTVAGVAFNLPPAAIRFSAQRRAGTQPRIDLAYQWPPLKPPDPAVLPVVSDSLAAQPLVFLSFAEAQEKLPAGERLKTIYPRFLAASAFVGPEGLTGIAFRDGTPYQGEDLLFDADRPEVFITRCAREVPAMPATCLIERRVGAVEVTVRFPRIWLDVWPALTKDIDALIEDLRARA